MADQSSRVSQAQRSSGPLDMENMNKTELTCDPWSHAVITGTFTSQEAADELTESFPSEGFSPVSQSGPDKQFVNEVRNDVHGDDLPAAWKALLRQVNSPQYREAVEQLVETDLSSAIVRAAFWRYGPACWLSPHTDDESKVVSHVMYFNADWPDDAGGRLLINGSKDINDVRYRVSPVSGTSLLIMRSQSSWHSVEPVNPHHARTRRSMTVVFHKPGFDLSYYGY